MAQKRIKKQKLPDTQRDEWSDSDFDPSIDFSEEHSGFLYILVIRNEDGDKLKFGCTNNPILRLGQHLHKTFRQKIGLMRVAQCFDYLKCEAEIKKELGVSEIVDFTPENKKVILDTINKYAFLDLDKMTVAILANLPSLKKYFNGKD